MSIYGALFSGVSGLNAQSVSLGIIADNITNVNTIGYKRTDAAFSTLVTDSATATNYSPGGVTAVPHQLIATQGLLQSSASPTDLSISGNGFFVVNTLTNPTSSSGQYLFTRAGSFTADADGNLRNTAGLYLQGWPIDTNGDIPVNRSDLTALQTVNIDGLTGNATPTTSISLKANLQASLTSTLSQLQESTASLGITSATDVAGTTALVNGDTFTITNGGVVSTFTYTTGVPSAAAGTFTSLQDLVNAINATTNATATVSSGADAIVTVTGQDASTPLVIAGTLSNGAGTPLFGAPLTVSNTYTVGDLATGTVAPQFERSLGIFDSQGSTRTLTFAYLKDPTIPNQWRTEIFVEPAADVDPTAHPNGLIASGLTAFNSDGTLDLTDTTVPSTLNITWAAGLGLAPSAIDLGIGTNGQTNGLTQFDGTSQLISSNVNGTVFGAFTGVRIDEAGVVTGLFDNGTTRDLYKLPVAIFSNPDGLSNVTGNAYALNTASGDVSLLEAGLGGAGKVSPSTLEASTVDLGQEFTNMITTQRAYSAAGKIITTADQMLDELISLKR